MQYNNMDNQVLRNIARKLGITGVEIVRKAAELERLVDVRGCSLNLNGSAKSVICLEIAATGSHVPVDRNMAISLSAMTKKAYTDAYKTIERILGKQKEYTLQDLAVQFGCLEASNLAQQIHQRYKKDFVHEVEDISHPVFVATALYTACKHMKIKIDKSKLMKAIGTKKSTFDSLYKTMEKIASSVTSGESKQELIERNYGLLDKVNEIVEGSTDQSCNKQQKVEGRGSSADDLEYEEWKQKILESAAKAMSKGRNS